jgi:hypothetical protein
MSVGVFDFHDHSSKHVEERLVNLCFNRFKTCQMDTDLHRYVLDTQVENGIISNEDFRTKTNTLFFSLL